MIVLQRCRISFRLDAHRHEGHLRIEKTSDAPNAPFRAVIESSPLRGTYGGEASSVALALDFLNLALQAEGADEICYECDHSSSDAVAPSDTGAETP